MTYKLSEQVIFYGRPAYICGRRIHSVSEKPGWFYDLKRDLASRKIDFPDIHESLIKPMETPQYLIDDIPTWTIAKPTLVKDGK